MLVLEFLYLHSLQKNWHLFFAINFLLHLLQYRSSLKLIMACLPSCVIRKIYNMNKWLPSNFDFSKCFCNNKFMFINIPKNASTSIRSTLKLRRCKFKNDKRIKFAVIRNPITRIISSFIEITKLRKDGPYQETLRTDWFKTYKNGNIRKSFNMFLNYIDNHLYNSHTHRQIDYIASKSLTIHDLDFVLLFEDLETQFNNMIKDSGMSIRLKYFNRPSNRHLKRINKLKRIAKELVFRNTISHIYKADFVLYRQAKRLSRL